MRDLGFTWLDVAALAWFFTWWIGYARFANWYATRQPSLQTMMLKYRRDWWVRVMERELRMIDTSIIANLSNSATFFASTTLFILGGLLALLGTTEKVSAVMQGMPFNKHTPDAGWEIKIMLLVGIFVYAFFKFTWSLRQHNIASVLIGAAPKVPRNAEDESSYIDQGAMVSHLAAEHFNFGLRAYYLALGALAWMINGWLFMGTTAWVVLILYWREFRSQALHDLQRPPLKQ
ncbi:MAG: DUF599 domain-containing protein [Betaproteobacteria bacterium]